MMGPTIGHGEAERSSVEELVTRGYATTGSRQVHYRRCGVTQHPPGGAVAGTLVLLLHQVSSSSAMFEAVMPLLARDGIECVAPDLPGFGASDPLPAGAGIEDYVDAQLAFLAAIGRSQGIVLVGHHTGARLGVLLAVREPELFSSLVAVGVPYYPDKHARVRRWAEKKVADPAPSNDAAHVLHEWERLGDLATGMDPELRTRELVDTLRAENYAAMCRLMFSYDIDPALGQLRVPTVFVACERDVLADKQKYAAAAVASAELATLPAGVFVFDEQPEAIAAVIRNMVKRVGGRRGPPGSVLEDA